MATPATPLRTRDPDGASRHTRDVEPTSPTNFQHLKRQRAVTTAPKRLDLAGKGAGTDTTAQAFLGKHLNDLDRDYMVRRQVISKLANTLDEFVSSFRGDDQQDHKMAARNLVTMVLEHLDANVFSKHTTNKAPQLTVASNEVPPSRPKGNVTWAAVLANGTDASRPKKSAMPATPARAPMSHAGGLCNLPGKQDGPRPFGGRRHEEGGCPRMRSAGRPPARKMAHIRRGKRPVHHQAWSHGVQSMPVSLSRRRFSPRRARDRPAAGPRDTVQTPSLAPEHGWCRFWHRPPTDSHYLTAAFRLA
ncbi:hypothetical protein E4U50_000313 [Claviceps purpurea]|nr:hypothetical protein E4U50_000313 [Claviceps purpurea]